jgi:hypothetical protein
MKPVCLNLGAGVVALADGFLLLFMTLVMGSTLVAGFDAWPHFWWLGLVISLLALALILILVMAVLAAREGRLPSSSGPAQVRRTLVYMLLPLVVSALISVVAAVGTLVVRGGLF